jgi:16S rRNA processing protein RimM
MEDLLQVGVITSPHGLKGEVKVFPTTDDVQRFKKLKEVILDTGKESIKLEIIGVKFFKNLVILKFKGLDDINEVEQYRQKSLLIRREQSAPLKEGEYFITDLIGLQVFTEDGKEFGVLADVMQTGANDVYIIKTLEAKEVLIPAIKDCVLNIDIKKQRMDIYLMPGLI